MTKNNDYIIIIYSNYLLFIRFFNINSNSPLLYDVEAYKDFVDSFWWHGRGILSWNTLMFLFDFLDDLVFNLTLNDSVPGVPTENKK